MKGFPKYLSTKEDYINVINTFPRETWEPKLQNLLANENEWFNIGKISDEGIEDDTHKVIIDEETGEKYQYELKENPNSPMKRLGFTREEILNYLKKVI